MSLARYSIGLVCFAIIAVLSAVAIAVVPRYQALELETVSSASFGVPTVPRIQILEGTISKNATLVSTLVNSGVPTDRAGEVATLVRPVFDVRKIHAGNSYRIEKELDGALRAFEYKIDDERTLKVAKAMSGNAGYDARIDTLELETRSEVVNVEIQTSLFNALDKYPKGELLTDSIAGIFAWDVDFNIDIRKGALIRLIVDEQFHNGTFVKYGPIQAAQLVNGGKTYRAFRFHDSYYDEKGNAVKRAFLSSPLKVMHITSGYAYRRMHPILGTERAHLAIDYGAPEGTSVFAVANGAVIFAGPNGDLGNFVQVRHSNGLTTGYGHLSRIASGIVTGRTIRQDDLVGLVGQTGLATGPHLHYMMTRAGKAINPLSIKAEPAVPMDSKLKPQYIAYIAGWKERLGTSAQAAAN